MESRVLVGRFSDGNGHRVSETLSTGALAAGLPASNSNRISLDKRNFFFNNIECVTDELRTFLLATIEHCRLSSRTMCVGGRAPSAESDSGDGCESSDARGACDGVGDGLAGPSLQLTS